MQGIANMGRSAPPLAADVLFFRLTAAGRQSVRRGISGRLSHEKAILGRVGRFIIHGAGSRPGSRQGDDDRAAPISQRVALSDVVVIGKVTGFGDKLVSAVPPYGGDKVDYQIAIVKVTDSTPRRQGRQGDQGRLHPPRRPRPPAMPGEPFLLISAIPQFTLALDQEGCLFLMKHPTEDFYIGQNYIDFINKTGNDGFDKNMDEVKRCASLLADPAVGLKAKNADDRFLTAGHAAGALPHAEGRVL